MSDKKTKKPDAQRRIDALRRGQMFVAREDQTRPSHRNLRRTIRVVVAEPDARGQVAVTSHNEDTGRTRSIRISAARLVSGEYVQIKAKGPRKPASPPEPSVDAKPSAPDLPALADALSQESGCPVPPALKSFVVGEGVGGDNNAPTSPGDDRSTTLAPGEECPA